MAISAEYMSKFEALHRQWWRLHMSEKFLNGTKNPIQIKPPKNIFLDPLTIDRYLLCNDLLGADQGI